MSRYFEPMSEDALIDEIGRHLADVTPARTRVVLFGSRARERTAHVPMSMSSSSSQQSTMQCKSRCG